MKDVLRNLIVEKIRGNSNQEITGQILQDVLLSIVDSVYGDLETSIRGYSFEGVATTATSPHILPNPLDRVFYLAIDDGLYSNFNGLQSTPITEFSIIRNLRQNYWEAISLKIPLNFKLTSELGNSTRKVMTQKKVTELYNEGYKYVGIAHTIDRPNPLTGEEKVFYFVTEEGNYAAYGVGNITELAIIKSNRGLWQIDLLGIPLNDAGYRFISTATPSTTPINITTKDRVFYLVTEEGNYPNFGLLGITKLSAIKSKNGRWVKEELEIPLTLEKSIADIYKKLNLLETKEGAEDKLLNAYAYTDTRIANLIDSAPEMLDTLYEIAQALKENEDIVNVLQNSITNKVDKEDGKGLSTNDFTDDDKTKLLYIDLLMDEVFPINILLSSSIGTITEFTGENKELKLSWNITRNNGVYIPDNIIIIKKDTQTEIEILNNEPSSNSGDIDTFVNNLGTTSFIFTIKDDEKQKSKQLNINSILPMFYGFSTLDSLLNDNINKFNKVVNTSFNGVLNPNNPTSGLHFFVAVPEKKVTRITSNGFDVLYTEKEDVLNINGTSFNYNIAVSTNPIQEGIMPNVVISIN